MLQVSFLLKPERRESKDISVTGLRGRKVVSPTDGLSLLPRSIIFLFLVLLRSWVNYKVCRLPVAPRNHHRQERWSFSTQGTSGVPAFARGWQDTTIWMQSETELLGETHRNPQEGLPDEIYYSCSDGVHSEGRRSIDISKQSQSKPRHTVTSLLANINIILITSG
jgi:hypothetical protein